MADRGIATTALAVLAIALAGCGDSSEDERPLVVYETTTTEAGAINDDWRRTMLTAMRDLVEVQEDIAWYAEQQDLNGMTHACEQGKEAIAPLGSVAPPGDAELERLTWNIISVYGAGFGNCTRGTIEGLEVLVEKMEAGEELLADLNARFEELGYG